MGKKLAIAYSLKRHRKINGTLFYCFEYFLYLHSIGVTVDLVLHNSTESELNSIVAIFKERYCFDEMLLSEIIRIERVSDFYKYHYTKVLFLDVHSLEILGMLTRAEILCYSNISNGMSAYKEKNVTYFGCYDYQQFDVFELLKFHFEAYRPIYNSANGVLVVQPDMDYKNIVIPEQFKDRNIILKKPNTAVNKLFEQFTSLYYVQGNRLDFNNRLIPECFFYHKEIVIERNDVIDSVVLRYQDIKDSGIEKYQLGSSDKMIAHFLD